MGLCWVAAARRRPSLSLCTEPLISTSDILSRIKQEVAFVGEQQFGDDRGMPTDPCAGEVSIARSIRRPSVWPLLHSPVSPSLSFPTGADALITAHDFLSWIKQEEEPCVREPWELPEREILPGPLPGPGPGEQRPTATAGCADTSWGLAPILPPWVSRWQ